MKGIFHTGHFMANTFKSVTKMGGGAFLVFFFIVFYSTLTFSGILFDFLNSYSTFSEADLVVTFYTPIIAVCASYLSVLFKRAACLYFSSNLKETISPKIVLQILLMLCVCAIGALRIHYFSPTVSAQRMQGSSIFIGTALVGSALLVNRCYRSPFLKNVAQLNFTDWYPACEYNCLVPIKKYKIIVLCITHSYFMIAAILMVSMFTYI